jgi:hypothetical protein
LYSYKHVHPSVHGGFKARVSTAHHILKKSSVGAFYFFIFFWLQIVKSTITSLTKWYLIWSFKLSLTAFSVQPNWASLIEVTHWPVHERIFFYILPCTTP